MAKTMVANLAIPSEANFTPAQIDTLRQVAARPDFRLFFPARELAGGTWHGPAREVGTFFLHVGYADRQGIVKVNPAGSILRDI